MTDEPLPKRQGPRPRTTPTNPHMQLDQQPTDPLLRDELARRVFALDGVEERPSAISVPRARALWLSDSLASGPPEAFVVGREFAHLHPDPDWSLHAMLPPQLAGPSGSGGLGRATPGGAARAHPRDGSHDLRPAGQGRARHRRRPRPDLVRVRSRPLLLEVKLG